MREGIKIEVSSGDRERLAAVAADRNSPQKHVWRARIILATAEGCGTAEVMRRAGVSKPCVWRWQERFMREGMAGLLRDMSRKPGLPPLPPALVDRVVALTLAEPPGETTHWTGRAMAATTGVSLRSVQRIWAAHGLQPHRVRRFKLSQDPAFAAKLRDVVGLYLDPPAHSLVLSVDEKSQIQALDRTQPGLPIKRGRAGTMTVRGEVPERSNGAVSVNAERGTSRDTNPPAVALAPDGWPSSALSCVFFWPRSVPWRRFRWAIVGDARTATDSLLKTGREETCAIAYCITLRSRTDTPAGTPAALADGLPITGGRNSSTTNTIPEVVAESL